MTKVLVVGAGVIGLQTALNLVRRGVHVKLVSPLHPLHPSTCSMGAGGLWMPFHCNDSRTDGWSFATLRELLRLSKNNSHYEEILPAIAFKRKQEASPSWALLDTSHEDIKNVLQFKNLTIDELYEESKLKKFRFPRKIPW